MLSAVRIVVTRDSVTPPRSLRSEAGLPLLETMNRPALASDSSHPATDTQMRSHKPTQRHIHVLVFLPSPLHPSVRLLLLHNPEFLVSSRTRLSGRSLEQTRLQPGLGPAPLSFCRSDSCWDFINRITKASERRGDGSFEERDNGRP